MENTHSDFALWLLSAIIVGFIVAVLTKGWLRGQHWQREMRLKKHRQAHTQRYH